MLEKLNEDLNKLFNCIREFDDIYVWINDGHEYPHGFKCTKLVALSNFYFCLSDKKDTKKIKSIKIKIEKYQ